MLQNEVETRVDQARAQVQKAMDWRGAVREHPWAAVGAAFAVGFYLGLR
jgi:ElaB/YqjD/DUF883 family membrane-anchored ribosome-binding protein